MRNLRIALALAASACAVLIGPTVASAATGKITGKAIDASTSSPISSLQVCAYTSSFEFGECDFTDSSGEYSLEGLEPDSYKVRFGFEEFGFSSNEYITQWYNGQPSFGAADTVTVTSGGTTAGINASMLQRGKISGTVTDATTGAAVSGIQVCAGPATSSGEEFYFYECATTSASGQYTITRLRAGSYKVEFRTPYKYNEALEKSEIAGPNYVTQYYTGKARSVEADAIAVSDGVTTGGINASMQPGATISGTVTDAVTGTPLEGIGVCAWGAVNYYCWTTEAGGQYSIATLPAGSYKVEFAPEFFTHTKAQYKEGKQLYQRSEFPVMEYVRQYFNNKFTFAEAEPVTTTAGAAIAGINAKMTKEAPVPVPKGVATVGAKAQVKGGKALLKLKCKGPGDCQGVVKLSAPKAKKGSAKASKKSSGGSAIGQAHFSIPAGKSKKVAVKLTGKGKALVEGAGKAGLKVTVSGSGVKKGTVTLKGAQRPRKKK